MKKPDNHGIKERISALMDGEVSEFEARRVLKEIDQDPSLREYWINLQLSSAVLRGESLSHHNRDVSTRVATSLLQPNLREKDLFNLVQEKYRIPKYTTAFAAGFLLMTVSAYSLKDIFVSSPNFSDVTSLQIENMVSSSEALDVLKKATLGLDLEMEEFKSGQEGQIYANYKSKVSGRPFMVSLSPISAVSNQALNSDLLKVAVVIKTKKGIFLLDVKGDVSQQEKSIILHNANFIASPSN